MKQITESQRYELSAFLKAGKSVNFIAQELGLHRSSIRRELNRNGKNGGTKYSPKQAHESAKLRKDRYTFNRKFTVACEKKVRAYLEDKWSPEQIVGYCLLHDIEMVSVERIYQFLREDKKNGGFLYLNLRHQLKHRKRPVGKHSPIKDRICIEERPAIVDEKTRFGDWELRSIREYPKTNTDEQMDTIIGANQQGAILTLTERMTNFVIILKLTQGKNAKGLARQIIDLLHPYRHDIHTITTDNGGEFAEHKMIAAKLNAAIYFAHPYCSWEKGSIEHANKLIRQYVPKKSNFDEFSQKQLTDIQHELNKRPRKKLKFKSPRDIFYKLAA